MCCQKYDVRKSYWICDVKFVISGTGKYKQTNMKQANMK